jgi:hypothetical protein
MVSILPFKMFTLEEVHGEIPQAIRPTKDKFEKLVEKHGLYRDLCGKKFMLDSDIQALFEIIRSRPKEADLRGGPARLIAAEPSPNELGYLVVLGDALDTEAPLHIGWAPREGDGIGDLKKLIQMGYPMKLATLEVCAATPAEVASVREKLAKIGHGSCYGGAGWFSRNEAVVGFLTAIRDQGKSVNEYDVDEDFGTITKIGA